MERMTQAVALKLWNAIVDYGDVMRLGTDEQKFAANILMQQAFDTLTSHRPVARGTGWAVKTVINTTAPLN